MFKEFDETKFNKKKEKSEYPVLKKALGADFHIVKEAMPDQLAGIEHHMTSNSWEAIARYLPKILEEAKHIVEEKNKQKGESI